MRAKLIGLGVVVVAAIIAVKVVHALIVPVAVVAVLGGAGYCYYKFSGKKG